MAYNFTTSSSQILDTGSTPITAEPLTLSVWFNRKDTSLQHVLLSVNKGAVASVGMFLISLPPSSSIANTVTNDGNFSTSSSSTTYSLNTWNHACGVFPSASSRTSWLNGVAGATNTETRAVSGVANVSIGGRYVSTTPSFYANCLIAECGIWNVALSQDEVISLSKGVSAALIRPQNLVFYAPLIRDLVDERDGRAITNVNGATVTDHPRIYR